MEKPGFSPAAPAGQNSIEISLLFGNGESVSSWKVEIASAGVTRKSWSGDASQLPPGLSWDGKDDSGQMSPEGTYSARLFVQYKEKYQPATAESSPFVLDISPPRGSITVDPPGFTPTNIGVSGPVTLTIEASSAVAKMKSWSLEVLDTSGELMKSWTGTWPDATAIWDGSSLGGGFVSPGSIYTAVATVRDEFGNSARLIAGVAVAELPSGPAVAAKPGPLSITATSAGFSPNGDKVNDTIRLALSYGDTSSVGSWKVTVSQQAGAPQKTWTGGSSSLPASLVWDGTTDAGSAAPEGFYTATLAVDYGAAHAAGTASSPAFILDLTPPSGSLVLSTPLFSPIESSDTISLKVDAHSPVARIDSWSMDIYDPTGAVFQTFSDKWPADTVVWNGRNPAGELVQSAEDYPVTVTVRDQFGNTGTIKGVVPIDILVEKTATGYRIIASLIFFKPFTPDFTDVGPELAAQNAKRLDALAEKLKKFPDYRILIVGHAVSIFWNDPVLSAREQKEVLIPLSRARADAIKAALVQRGLEEARFTTDGVGASDQVVPDSDYSDRWQNRRVALFLEK